MKKLTSCSEQNAMRICQQKCSQMPYLPAKVHQLMPSATTHCMLLRVLAASDFECLDGAGRN